MPLDDVSDERMNAIDERSRILKEVMEASISITALAISTERC